MRKICLGILGCLVLMAPRVFALGINYAEVLVENLQIGTTYNLTQIANMPLEVNNDSDVPLTIQIDPLKPEKPIEGYEAIPNAAWIKIKPNKFPMQARTKHLSDIQITIPKDQKILGKKYQVDLFAHTAETDTQISFMNVKLGLKGRLLFTVAPMVMKASSRKPASVNLNFKITPERFEVSEVPLGKKHEVLTAKQASAEIENFGTTPLDISIESLDPATVGVKDDQYGPCPDPRFLTFEKSEIAVPGKTKAALKMWLEVPNLPEYRNKKYLFLISVANTGAQMSGRRHVRLYVKTGGAEVTPAGK